MVMSGMHRIALLTLLLAACTGCGSNQVRGQAPFVSILSLGNADGTLQATVGIRNINDVALHVDTLVIRARSGDVALIDHASALNLEIDPNTTDDVVIEHRADQRALSLLESLESGAVASLPFSLDGSVHTGQDGNLRFQHQGFLFRVPGRPGQFRATSTRAPEPR